MPAFGPINREKLIRCLKELEFVGPFIGGKHQYMVKGQAKLFIPNPHKSDISSALLGRILQQAGITKDQWEKI